MKSDDTIVEMYNNSIVEPYTTGNEPMHVEISDPVNHPKHYTSHPSGVECIQITRHMNFNLGNAFKYWFRRYAKNNPLEDMQKAQWYLTDYVNNISKLEARPMPTGLVKLLAYILKYEDAESIIVLTGLVYAQFMGNTTSEYRLMLNNVLVIMERTIEVERQATNEDRTCGCTGSTQ
jgi:hypothetical protein